jgi:antitoxin component YwqK of YwqJK toxin-antitoxin module
MRQILAPILLLVLLFPALALGGEVKWDDLVERDGLYYKKVSDVPFTGKITGKSQGSLKDGKLNGRVWEKITYKDMNKEGPYVTYHDNGGVREKITYKDGNIEGPYVSYHDNGQLDSKGTYKDGTPVDGPWVSYHDNGQLKSKGTYKDGKRDGPWVFFEWDGTKRTTPRKEFGTILDEGFGTYKNGVKISD